MSNQKSLKEEIKENKAKFKELSFFGKVSFIADYYKLPIFAFLLAIIVILAIIKTVQDNNYDTALNVVIVNNPVPGWVEEDDSLEHAISEGVVPYLGVDNVSNRVLINDYYLVNDIRDVEGSALNAQKLTLMFASSEIDIFICDKKAIRYFASDKDPFFYDLSTILEKELFACIKDSLIMYTYKDNSQIPFALDVTGTKFATSAGFVSDEVYIAIPNNTERLETAIQFLQYVLSVNESSTSS